MARLSKVHMSSKPLVPITPARPTPPPKTAPKADLVATSSKAARSNLRGLMEAVADTWGISPAEMIDHKTVKSTPHPSSSKPIEATTDFLSFPNGTPRQNIATTVKIRGDTPQNGLGSLQQTSDIFDSLAPGRRLESQAVDALVDLDDQDPLPNAARITPDDIGRAKARFARWTAKAKTSLQHVCAENIEKLEAYSKHINDAKEVILGAQHYRGPKFHAELTRLETVAHAREKIFQGFLELPDPSPEDIIQSERARSKFEEDRHRFQGFAESRRGLRSAELALQLESDDVARRIEALREMSKRLEDE
ncbi:hypothetical protein K4K53_009030 [Colletotrichum sp. SAR 10_77]|nr:hypothetical protein K4K53_009030 [Colletotrichum sp. SAR 10_77]